MPLKILHLSDIHFKYYANGQLNLDEQLQNELLLDLEELVRITGDIDIILIGGDVAFSGHTAEYVVAETWLGKVCEIISCQTENILMVPGNHDVERGKICPVLTDVQAKFKSLKVRSKIDPELEKYLTVPESTFTLLKPFTNYNNFAQKYGVNSGVSNTFFWEKDFVLGRKKLRIRGVNSALFSNKGDDVHTAKLLLGSHQSNILRKPDVIDMVLCHHPPQWLYDGDDVEKDFLSRAKIHLYGHKHAFNATKVGECLVLAAGAMQPDRTDLNWEPRYNILELDEIEEDGNDFLKVILWRRVYDKNKDRTFKAEYSDDNEIHQTHKLLLGKTKSSVISKPQKKVDSIRKTEIEKEENMGQEPEIINPSDPNNKRKLAYYFLGLPYHQKLQVAFELELIQDSDADLNELQKSQVYFKRAEEMGVFKQLWDKVRAFNPKIGDNPF